MDYKEIVDNLKIESVIELMRKLGADRYKEEENQIIFPTICHNESAADASMKLYFYKNYKQFHCYTDQCFLCDAMHRKTKGSYVHVSTVSSLAQGGLLVPGYIMQELKAINCAVCEPSRRHCRQGRETLARICINPSKNTSALLAG